ncbi:cystatin-like [Pholidichthys leucotaenia]
MWKAALPIFAALLAVGFSTGEEMLMGGRRNMDVNSERAQSMVNFAIAEHNRRSNDLFFKRVVEVVKVESQVVSGIMYHITAKMGKTTCAKNHVHELCGFSPNEEPFLCTFEVWSRPWMNELTLNKETCP